MLKEKKIPTILGVLILVGGLLVGTFLTNQNTNPISKASGDCAPVNPQVTNTTDNSAAVSFVTQDACFSSLLINNQTFSNLASSDSNEKNKIHYFEIINLEDSREYEYYLINDSKEYKDSSYFFRTAQKPSGNIPSSSLAWGRVFDSESKPVGKVIVFINIPEASPLSSLTTSQGNWNISLSNSFNESKSDRFSPKPNTAIEIIVIDQNKQITQVSGNTSQNNPAPDIILGQNQLSPLSVNYQPESDPNFLSSIIPVPIEKELDIINPKDGDAISTKRPDFFGTAPINSKIIIKLESTPVYQDEIFSQDDGSWNWSPPADLSPGEHTLTITSEDKNGIKNTISRKFTVLASSNPLSYTSSPSATISPSSPTSIPILTPTVVSTIPTSAPTLKPNPSPTPIIATSQPSTSSGVPVSGNLAPTLIILLLSSSSVVLAASFLKKK